MGACPHFLQQLVARARSEQIYQKKMSEETTNKFTTVGVPQLPPLLGWRCRECDIPLAETAQDDLCAFCTHFPAPESGVRNERSDPSNASEQVGR
jgi:rubrerythrin